MTRWRSLLPLLALAVAACGDRAKTAGATTPFADKVAEDIPKIENVMDDDDRAAAAQAVVEGEATYEQIYIMAGGSGNIAAQLPGGWESMRSVIREAQATQPVFSSAPMVIQETLLFPYINGADFVRRFHGHFRKGRLPFDSMPVSTEQVMHDTAYFGKPRDEPSSIELPSIPGTIEQNKSGEF